MIWGEELGIAMEYSDAKTVTGPKQQGHCCLSWKLPRLWALLASSAYGMMVWKSILCSGLFLSFLCLLCMANISLQFLKEGKTRQSYSTAIQNQSTWCSGTLLHKVITLIHKVILKNLVNPCMSSKCVQDYPTELLIHRTWTNEHQKNNRLYWVICVFGHPILQVKSFR